MDPEVSRFVERIGLSFEQQGLALSAGRVAGLMMVSDEPLSLDAIASQLGISKASVSLATRLLEGGGLISRVTLRGDRKIYFEMAVDAWSFTFRQKWPFVEHLADLAREGREAFGESSPIIGQRLQEMEDFYRFVADELQIMLEKWEQRNRE